MDLIVWMVTSHNKVFKCSTEGCTFMNFFSWLVGYYWKHSWRAKTEAGANMVVQKQIHHLGKKIVWPLLCV